MPNRRKSLEQVKFFYTFTEYPVNNSQWLYVPSFFSGDHQIMHHLELKKKHKIVLL